MEEAKRNAICELTHAGHSPMDIVCLLKYKKTVYNVYNKWRVEGNANGKGHAPRSDKKRNANFVWNLKATVTKTPTPPSLFANRRQVSTMTVSRCLKEDMKMKSFQFSKKHILTEAQKTRRLERCKELIDLLRSPGRSKLTYFSNEKVFNVDANFNQQNDLRISKNRQQFQPSTDRNT